MSARQPKRRRWRQYRGTRPQTFDNWDEWDQIGLLVGTSKWRRRNDPDYTLADEDKPELLSDLEASSDDPDETQLSEREDTVSSGVCQCLNEPHL